MILNFLEKYAKLINFISYTVAAVGGFYIAYTSDQKVMPPLFMAITTVGISMVLMYVIPRIFDRVRGDQ
ncbi:hypothetical protein ABEO98_21640 [Brevibacillus parabrevis]|uniref:hypothetical protein n=1 Tax=Brevibacillus parabrevis TaxID=54914 RepID=UPI002E1EF8DE|nr:hypothetical protein [Brevibacillus parabrevis]